MSWHLVYTAWNLAVPSLCWWLLGHWILGTKGKLSTVSSLRKCTEFRFLGSLAILPGPTEPKGDFCVCPGRGRCLLPYESVEPNYQLALRILPSEFLVAHSGQGTVP